MKKDSQSTDLDTMYRARLSLSGLSVGDAFGERFFAPGDAAEQMIRLRALPAPPWRFTDDTVMALSIVEVLGQHACINQEELAKRFGARFAEDPGRGYGPGYRLSSWRPRHDLCHRRRDRDPGHGGGFHTAGVVAVQRTTARD